MEGDLSLSQSLGGLRIANPDDASPASTPTNKDDSNDSESSPPALRTSPQSAPRRSPPSAEPQSKRLSLFNILRRNDSSSEQLSDNSSPPQSADREPRPLVARTSSNFEPPTHQDPLARAAAAKAYRQSMPLNHQAQQQAQFPPYASNQMQNGGSGRGYPPPNSRPISGVYAAQPPPNAMPPPQQPGQYRLQREPSQSSLLGVPIGVPKRSNSQRESQRALAVAMQAGVPSRENSHRERAYNTNQQLPAGNGPLPPRHSSRNMATGPSGSPSRGPMTSANGLDNGGMPTSSDEWRDRGAAVGIRQEYDANGQPVLRSVKKGVTDFAFGRVLGEGSYSTVLAATDRQTLKEYAVKMLDKRHIIKEKKIKYVNIEKDTLNRLTEHPGIVRLYYTFQDQKSLYYVLDVASGGELLGVLKKMGTFDVECTRFYGAQILDAIDYMHSRGVIHRDLKPENVLLDDQMHVKITDFGTAKLLRDPKNPKDQQNPRGMPPGAQDMEDEDSRATSFVGTAEYVSPELLTDKNACKASDLWAFGCIIYQLLSGRPPFKAANEYLTFQKIVSLEYEFPPGFPPAARDLVERLLVLDPNRRLSIEHIKNHEFFDGVRWGKNLWRMKAPRLKSYVPPAQEPNIIQLGSYNNGPPPPPQPMQQPLVTQARNAQPGSAPIPTREQRPQPRIITELPPPTQLDIEWSPVLTRQNERILKLGNMMVLATPIPHSPNSKNGESHGEGHKKFSRFFGGSTTKKRQRLVMVTSSARIIMAAAGGDEKKTKSEISLQDPDCQWRMQTDAKGLTVWVVDSRGTHYTFEDPKSANSNTAELSKASAQEWIDSIERAKDLAISQSLVGSYNSDLELGSSMSTPTSSTLNSVYPEGLSNSDRNARNHLTKSQASLPNPEDPSKRHRFSKRQSKNGLAAVF